MDEERERHGAFSAGAAVDVCMEDFEAFMDRFEIEVRYKSIYGEVFEMATDKPPVCY